MVALELILDDSELQKKESLYFPMIIVAKERTVQRNVNIGRLCAMVRVTKDLAIKGSTRENSKT